MEIAFPSHNHCLSRLQPLPFEATTTAFRGCNHCLSRLQLLPFEATTTAPADRTSYGAWFCRQDESHYILESKENAGGGPVLRF